MIKECSSYIVSEYLEVIKTQYIKLHKMLAIG